MSFDSSESPLIEDQENGTCELLGGVQSYSGCRTTSAKQKSSVDPGWHEKPKTPLKLLYKFFRSFPVQVLMVFVVLIDLIFLVIEFATEQDTYESVTVFTALSFVIELLVIWGYEGNRSFFMFDRWWLIAEILIIWFSFSIEYIEFLMVHQLSEEDLAGKLRYLKAVRFLRVFIIWKTRVRHFKTALRALVSADRRRYQFGGYDLDLTYVYSNIIATSWPSDGTEAFYRNQIDTVAAFLDETHEDAYEVYNLCSERSYDESKFHDRVVRFPMDDHNPCELGMMLDFAKHVKNFISTNPMSNVAVIHCKGGKGRTGTMTCAYLLYAGLHATADEALERFGRTRTSASASKFQGVESPSQDRFVHYFERLLTLPNLTPPARTIRITSVKVKRLPVSWWDVSKLWYAIILRPTSNRVLHYVSNPTVSFNPVLPENPYAKSRKKSMSPANSPQQQVNAPGDHTSNRFEGDEDEFVVVGGCKGFSGNMIVYVDDEQRSNPMSVEQFHAAHCAASPGSKPQAKEASNKSKNVTLEFNTSSIPPVAGDVHIKFFYDVDQPNPLSAPIQIWYHPSFEEDGLHLPKMKLDGPHKDKKHKRYHKDFGIDIDFETCAE